MARKISVEIVGDAASLERSFVRAGRSAKGFERNLAQATRGAVAGSGAFRHLGRSIAFASGGFLAFASAGDFLRKSIDAARDAAVTQRQLSTQMKASGASFGAWRSEIDKTTMALSHLSGFEDDELLRSLTTLDRSTGDITQALRLNAVAADVARGRHISLQTAATALGKAYLGQTTALKRLGISLPKTATGMEAIRLVAEKFAGQAKAGATAADRFGAALQNSEEIIGGALLPTLNKYLEKGANWLNQMNSTGRLQRDVSEAAHQLGQILAGVKAVVTPLAHAFEQLGNLVGGTKNEVELLSGAFLLLKTRTALINWGFLIGEVSGVGGAARTSTGQVNGLRASLMGLNGLVIKYAIVQQVIKQVIPGHAGMGLDFSEPTTGDTTVRIGGKTYVKGSIAELEARQRQALQRKYGIPSGNNIFGWNVKPTSAGSGTPSPGTGAGSAGLGLPSNVSGSAQVGNPFALPHKVSGSAMVGRTGLRFPMVSGEAFVGQSYSTPLGLQLAASRAAALGQDLDSVLVKERAAAMRALKSGRLAIQGQIDAWNEIASINEQLGSSSARGTHAAKMSGRKLVRGLGLSHTQMVSLEQRYAQAEAHNGYTPVGVGALGQVVINVHGDPNPEITAKKVLDKLQKHAKRNAGQTRGRHGGRNLGLH